MVYSCPRSIKFGYVSSRSQDLAGQAFLFLSGSDVRPIFIFAISNSYVLLSLLNTLGKPEKLYCTGFGQANAEIQRFEEH